MRPLLLPTTLTMACAYPSTVALRTDALIPPAGRVEIVAMGGAGRVATDGLPEGESPTRTGAAGQVTLGLPGGTALTLGAGTDTSHTLYTSIEGRLTLFGVRPEDWGLVALVGVEPIAPFDEGFDPLGGYMGIDAGLVVGRTLPRGLRPFGGLRMDMIPLADADDMIWAEPGIGFSDTLPVSPARGLLLGFEAFAVVDVRDPSYGPGVGGLLFAGMRPR